MTAKELKKLGRSELLEMLIAQSEENESLREQVLNLHRSLDERRFIIQKAGSIAEASLMVNKVFEAAEAAAQDYINNVRHLSERQSDVARRSESETDERIQQMLEDTERRCQLLESDTAKKCEEMIKNAKLESDKYYDSARAKIDEYLKQHSILREMFSHDFPSVDNIKLNIDEEKA